MTTGGMQRKCALAGMPLVLVGLTSCGAGESSNPAGSSTGEGLLVDSGNLSFEAILNSCPVIDDLTAAPLNLRLGGVSSLFVSAHDSDHAPSPLAYEWAVNGARLSGQAMPALSFTCTSLGEVTIASSVSDGDPNPACANSASVKVSCE